MQKHGDDAFFVVVLAVIHHRQRFAGKDDRRIVKIQAAMLQGVLLFAQDVLDLTAWGRRGLLVLLIIVPPVINNTSCSELAVWGPQHPPSKRIISRAPSISPTKDR